MQINLKHGIFAVAILGIVIVSAEELIFRPKAINENFPQQATFAAEKYSRPRFSLEKIMGVDAALAHAEVLRKQNTTRYESLNVKMAVIPHHAFVVDELDRAWRRLRSGSDPSVIVLVGPNHDDIGISKIQTTDGLWQTPLGEVEADQEIVKSLVDSGIAEKTTEVFSLDHSIGVHIPYVAALFPKTKIVPIVFTHTATAVESKNLLNGLAKVLPDDAVFVFSIDFSHYLTADEARVKDIETFGWLTSKNTDAASIDAAGSDHFDSHASVNMFLLAEDYLGCNNHLSWHGNSGEIADDFSGQTTSYFIWMCDAASKESLVISAGGDVMLDRGITPIFNKMNADNFMLDIAMAFFGSEIRFANLESVISNKGQNSNKEISFRADTKTFSGLEAADFNVLSVSNNHALDWGRSAWDDSYKRLQEANILPIGGFTNFETKPVVTEINGKKVAFLAFNSVDRVLNEEMIGKAVDEAVELAPFVIVSFHWGVEYKHQPTGQMQNFAHAAIDHGADLILGGHPHVLQGFEIYKNKLVAYSLGNLVFDQIREETHQSVVARIVIDENGKGILEVIPLQIDNKWVNRYAEPVVGKKTIADIASWSFGDLKEKLKNGFVAW